MFTHGVSLKRVHVFNMLFRSCTNTKGFHALTHLRGVSLCLLDDGCKLIITN